MVGGHASFTLSDESLGELGRVAQDTGSGLHIHVAEDRADVEDCQARFGCGPVERLERHGLLRPGTLLAHCVHLSPAEATHAQGRGCWIAHNPRSNMNNAVGRAPQGTLQRAALGTDGMDQDLLAEARAAYLNLREAGRSDAATAAVGLLAGGHRLAAALFGLPFGKLDAGAPADLVVLDYRPPTPIHSENLAGHLLFGVDRSHVASVMVAGRLVVRDRQLTGLDVPRILDRARRAAETLLARMNRG
jgi:cytosine/adenosine deaminase-related metal-dependent hydrolase